MTDLTLSPAAHALAQALHGALRKRWADLPGEAEPARPLPDYHAAPVPADLRSRRAELIVEASDLAALRAALASGADAVALDFDDTFAPTRANVQVAYDALPWALAGEGARLVRPRALYAAEPGLTFGGEEGMRVPGIAALCDLAAILTAAPTRPPHLYIPKLEMVAEARFWDDALALAEAHLGLEQNTVRVCLQIETFAGVRHADALLHALRDRAYGLNAGRWDYVFSLTKRLGQSRRTPLPPRAALGMDVDAMQAYAETLVRVCRRRNAEAVGGTAAVAPDPQDPRPALEAVRADKAREAAQGFTAAWAALPGLLGAVREGFAAAQPVLLPDEPPEQTLTRLTDLPDAGPLPLATVRDTLGLALDVFAAWFAGQGMIVRAGRLEDTATAELARAQLWQWRRVGAALEGGGRLTAAWYLHERRALLPDDHPAARLLDHLVLADAAPAYFPRAAQRLGLGEYAL
ncbi:aldolase/citrate lyase family protein [Deinococcus sp. Leaf326]|uniref:aldolase/citrate lyase family protein n=1 Tax=Deinococcus sp. Leaf326 TaxID=1736338 RepID=UPI0006FAACDC|nr:aldolase/citrate lyase family protein [Deinococcus sp. Leaf326]KQR22942.1 malate synthase [Deinococcus sp. Leaf326]